jgi:hypothetical protein
MPRLAFLVVWIGFQKLHTLKAFKGTKAPFHMAHMVNDSISIHKESHKFLTPGRRLDREPYRSFHQARFSFADPSSQTCLRLAMFSLSFEKEPQSGKAWFARAEAVFSLSNLLAGWLFFEVIDSRERFVGDVPLAEDFVDYAG